MATMGFSTRTPLRMRVSMSATVSVIMVMDPLAVGRRPANSPARLLDPRDQALAGQAAEADAADAEIPVIGARAAAERAPVAVLHLELAGRIGPDHLGLGGHGAGYLVGLG